ncbi:MAG TPA: serpin family protein [Planctomycetes bacterium]|nr:serpin family protein [Planctomycetota bacterium]
MKAIYLTAVLALIPAATAGGEAATPQERAMAACQRTVSFDFFETPLDEAVEFLRLLSGEDIRLQQSAAEKFGKTPVTLRVERLGLGDALVRLGRQAGLRLFIDTNRGFLMLFEKKGEPAADDSSSPLSSGGAAERQSPMSHPNDIVAVVKGNNAFGLDLYARLRQESPGDRNLFLSPYSISTALAMTCAGARGRTVEQMEQVLRFPYKGDRMHTVFAGLQAGLGGGDEKRDYELRVANALWGQKGYRFLEPFLALTRLHYGAGLMQVDFQNDTEGARNTINEWVEEHTNRKIRELLARGTITDDVRLVLTNAIYFLGAWQQPFEERRTREEPFRLASGGSVNAPLMRMTGTFRYLQGDGFQALELPYKGGDLAMLLLLPAAADGLPQLEAKLTRQNLDAWINDMRSERVDVMLPRFKMTAQFELSKTLSAMGMTDAFVWRQADFSGMDGGRDLFIGLVIHKAFVDVNEKGTEAAAATAVVMYLGSAPLEEQPVLFRADRPFLFAIRHVRTGSIVFIGRLSNPRAN